MSKCANSKCNSIVWSHLSIHGALNSCARTHRLAHVRVGQPLPLRAGLRAKYTGGLTIDKTSASEMKPRIISSLYTLESILRQQTGGQSKLLRYCCGAMAKVRTLGNGPGHAAHARGVLNCAQTPAQHDHALISLRIARWLQAAPRARPCGPDDPNALPTRTRGCKYQSEPRKGVFLWAVSADRQQAVLE